MYFHYYYSTILSSHLDETWDRKSKVNDSEEVDETNELQSNQNNSNPCTIQYHMPQFRRALQWDHFFPCIRTPKYVKFDSLCYKIVIF